MHLHTMPPPAARAFLTRWPTAPSGVPLAHSTPAAHPLQAGLYLQTSKEPSAALAASAGPPIHIGATPVFGGPRPFAWALRPPSAAHRPAHGPARPAASTATVVNTPRPVIPAGARPSRSPAVHPPLSPLSHSRPPPLSSAPIYSSLAASGRPLPVQPSGMPLSFGQLIPATAAALGIHIPLQEQLPHAVRPSAPPGHPALPGAHGPVRMVQPPHGDAHAAAGLRPPQPGRTASAPLTHPLSHPSTAVPPAAPLRPSTQAPAGAALPPGIPAHSASPPPSATQTSFSAGLLPDRSVCTLVATRLATACGFVQIYPVALPSSLVVHAFTPHCEAAGKLLIRMLCRATASWLRSSLAASTKRPRCWTQKPAQGIRGRSFSRKHALRARLAAAHRLLALAPGLHVRVYQKMELCRMPMRVPHLGCGVCRSVARMRCLPPVEGRGTIGSAPLGLHCITCPLCIGTTCTQNSTW